MRTRFVISIAAVLITVFGLLSCNSVDRSLPVAASVNSNTTEQKASDIRRMTTAELKELVDKGQAFIVDVRTEASYKSGHIKGAILIPHKAVASRIKELPRDKTIVTYCS